MNKQEIDEKQAILKDLNDMGLRIKELKEIIDHLGLSTYERRWFRREMSALGIKARPLFDRLERI